MNIRVRVSFWIMVCPTNIKHLTVSEAQGSGSESAAWFWLLVSHEDTVAVSVGAAVHWRLDWAENLLPCSAGCCWLWAWVIPWLFTEASVLHCLAFPIGLVATGQLISPHSKIQERADDGNRNVLEPSLRIGHHHSAGVYCSHGPTLTQTPYKPGDTTRWEASGATLGPGKHTKFSFAKCFITIWYHDCFINTDGTLILKY